MAGSDRRKDYHVKPETASEQFAVAQIAALVRLAPAEVAVLMFLSEFDRAAHDELDHSACTACQKTKIHGLENSKANGSGPPLLDVLNSTRVVACVICVN